jgi:predicted dehydrogenase
MIHSTSHRVALIGGFSSVAAARAELPLGCELVALCDVRADLLARCRAEDPSLFYTEDFQQIATHKGIDTVATFTPNATHRDIAVACLRGGKNVFIEKPMGCSLEEGRDILRAESESGGKFCGVDLEYRYSPMTGVAIKQIIDSGEIGRVLHIELDHNRGGWLNDTPSGAYRTKRATSGLMMMEGIHQIDLFRHWAGEINAVQAFAAPNALPHYEFPDNANVVIWFENGAMGRYTASHTRSAYQLPRESLAAPLGHHMRWGVTGTKGSLIADAWSQEITLFGFTPHPRGSDSLRPDFVRSIGFAGLLQPHNCHHDMLGCRNEFLSRMAAGRAPYQSAADSYRSEVVATACDQSLYEDHRRVTV